MAAGLEAATSIPSSTFGMNWNSRISLQNVLEHLSRTVEVAKGQVSKYLLYVHMVFQIAVLSGYSHHMFAG